MSSKKIIYLNNDRCVPEEGRHAFTRVPVGASFYYECKFCFNGTGGDQELVSSLEEKFQRDLGRMLDKFLENERESEVNEAHWKKLAEASNR